MLSNSSPGLPLDDAWPSIRAALESHQNLVLVAEPGAGKTTRLPPLLRRSGLLPENQKILMLEPRRIAARASTSRIATEQKWEIGREIGYQVRFDNRTTSTTRLDILTEGLLSRRLQTDPELNNVSCVILDEFHERSQHTDLAIGLLIELQQLSRPDLRLIVMSATLDADRVASFLGDAPIVRVPGRTYPVDVHHSKHPLLLETGPNFLDRVAETAIVLMEGTRPRAGDVLVFLPGTREIRGVRDRIQSRAERAGFDCLELHGSLMLEEQERALKPAQGRSRIVLATNIAETSLTLDGVGTVIDTGLARIMRTDAAGFPRLQTSRISLASATQRAGRAGRQAAGHCYRLWSKIDEASMPAFELPEILRADLTEPLMILLSQGVSDPTGFSWFEKPSSHLLKTALDTLTDLGLRDGQTGQLTALGVESLKLPLPARPARLLIEAARINEVSLGAKLAALLTEKDIIARSADLKRLATIESDPLIRLHLLDSARGRGDVDPHGIRSVQRVADALTSAARRIDFSKLQKSTDWAKGKSQDDLALRLLLLGYPDRVARRRRPKELAARMVGGRGVRLAPFSSVETSELFIALDSMEPPPSALGSKSDAQISLASMIERSWLEEFFADAISSSFVIAFDEASLQVQKQAAKRFHDLPLEEAKISRPETNDAFQPLIDACLERWETHFAPLPSLASLWSRIRFIQTEQPDFQVDLEGAKRAALEEACFGETRLSSVLEKPFAEIMQRHFPTQLNQTLSESAPASLVVPSGSRIPVEYPEGRPPFIEVRIQEIFGWLTSPRLAGGRIALSFHLLAPNFRPVQVTSDLESFWRTGYNEVRKELRIKYPKHSWPEDPFSAKPEAKGRPRSGGGHR